MKYKLVVVVGHSKDAQGAMATAPLSCSEFQYNNDIAERLQGIAKLRSTTELEVSVDIIHRPQKGFTGIRKAYERVSDLEPDAAIELHFNAFNRKVRGTETLFSDADDENGVLELELAQLCQSKMCTTFKRRGRQDRGLKRRPRTTRERGWYNVNQSGLYPCLLVEPFFGDNPADAELANNNRDEYAIALFEAFLEWTKILEERAGYS